MKLRTAPLAAVVQVGLLLVLLGGCVWAILSLRACAHHEQPEFFSPENRRRLAALYLEPATRPLFFTAYGPDWPFPFDGFDPEDPARLAALSADPDLRERSAATWTALYRAGHLDEFNYQILVRRARINASFAVEEGRRPVILVDSDSFWHLFWSDGSTSSLAKPDGDGTGSSPPPPAEATPPTGSAGLSGSAVPPARRWARSRYDGGRPG